MKKSISISIILLTLFSFRNVNAYSERQVTRARTCPRIDWCLRVGIHHRLDRLQAAGDWLPMGAPFSCSAVADDGEHKSPTRRRSAHRCWRLPVDTDPELFPRTVPKPTRAHHEGLEQGKQCIRHGNRKRHQLPRLLPGRDGPAVRWRGYEPLVGRSYYHFRPDRKGGAVR